MKVLMLGWEFPPFISGGLGTACFGLTRALDSLGVTVYFILPRHAGSGGPAPPESHVRILSGAAHSPAASAALDVGAPRTEADALAPWTHAVLHAVDAALRPYVSPETYAAERAGAVPAAELGASTGALARSLDAIGGPAAEAGGAPSAAAAPRGAAPSAHAEAPQRAPENVYGGDLFAEVQRYAALAVAIARETDFDVIHAHDWMTFPAGIAVASLTRKPLIVHVHSTEFDRSGIHVNQGIYDIERAGMHACTRVIAVSHLTRNIAVHRYGVDPRKIEVVYNGIDDNGHAPTLPAIQKDEKIVLFLGRITMQKGPEYFLQAAKRVLEVMDNVRFIMAGSGDMIRGTIEMAASMGIGHRVLFTGFLRGDDVRRVYRMADLYVMPSVSEPFGIAPLEAISQDVPVLISKQSGVAEVLTHALKVDFWDIDEMANKIVAVLRHPPLQSTLREHSRIEVGSMTWTEAAGKCLNVYQRVCGRR